MPNCTLFAFSLSLPTRTHQPPKHIESFGSISGYYIGYKIDGSDKPYTFKTIESHVHSKLETVITNLKKATLYTFSVQAFNTKGAGPASSEVTAKTLDKDPPLPPRVTLISTSATSATLTWSMPNDSSPVNGRLNCNLNHRQFVCLCVNLRTIGSGLNNLNPFDRACQFRPEVNFSSLSQRQNDFALVYLCTLGCINLLSVSGLI